METIMCIQWKSNHLGCSYYSSHSLELFLMEDIRESNQFEYINMLIAQVLPKLIILPDSSENELLEYFEKEHGASIDIKKMSSKDFLFKNGRYMLLNWYIRHIQMKQTEHVVSGTEPSVSNQHVFMVDPEEGNQTHAYLQLEGLIHVDSSQLTIGCAGVLLKHLQNIEQEEGIDGSQNELSIQPILLRNFSCEKCMHVNSDTIRSLGIFNYESHPNMHQKHGKESLSLFGLLNKTTSVLGKIMFTEWVSKPTTDKDVLDYRHESVRFFLQVDMRDIVLELSGNLKHIKNIHRLLAKVKESKSNPNDWQNILNFAYYTIRILSLLNQSFRYGSDIAFMNKTRNHLSAAEIMKVIGSDINDTIDFETSKAEGRIIVKENINSELDLLRRKYEALDSYLLQVSQEISATLPVGLGAILNVVYFPQLGYLITLPQHRSGSGDNKSVSSSSHVGDYYAAYLNTFELQFTTSENMYYKNDRMKELDETIGDIYAMIVDKEIEIIQELSERVLQYTDQLSEVVNILSELDCLISLSLAALRFNYVEPIMTMDDSLIITQGRHPLQELCVDIFIPNDTYLQGGRGFKSKTKDHLSTMYESETLLTKLDVESTSISKEPTGLTKESNISLGPTTTFDQVKPCTENQAENMEEINSVQIVTGANFSGKSVYLKQIALIVYMAHIGSYVPAEKAIIGITDKLFTRIQTSETVSKPQSAFAFDLQQLYRALNNSTNHSLVIIDEFGKGTDSSDGAALFCAVIGYFLSKCETCPKIVASTHFHDVISQDILSKEDGITLSQTEILSRQPAVEQEENQGEEGDEVVFLYRIVPGKGPSASYGIWCAGIAGLPSSTIERAIELSECFQNDKPIEKIETDHENYNMLKLIRNKFLQTDLNQLNPEDLISSIESLF